MRRSVPYWGVVLAEEAARVQRVCVRLWDGDVAPRSGRCRPQREREDAGSRRPARRADRAPPGDDLALGTGDEPPAHRWVDDLPDRSEPPLPAVGAGPLAGARRALHPPFRSIWLCIHRYEASWHDGGAPYYGGLQMDVSFQLHYGRRLYRLKGTADHWTPLEQIWVAEKARRSGRGFSP